MIPEWLLKEDDYVPKEEKNLYIEKSIFSLIKTVSIIRKNKSEGGLLYAIHPTLKVLSTVLTIVLIGFSRSFIYLLGVGLYVLVILFLIDKKSRKRIVMRSGLFPCITLIALIPSMFYGNIYNSLLLFQKILTTIVLVNVLAHHTKWSEMTKSLKLLYIPDLFIWIIDITIKYIVLLGEYGIHLLYALKLRSIGTTSNKYDALTGIIGHLFIKSYKMSEELFCAMECRGFVGEYSTKIKFDFKKIDFIYITINILLISLFVYSSYVVG